MVSEELLEELLCSLGMYIEIAEAQRSNVTAGEVCNRISNYYRSIAVCWLFLYADAELYGQMLINSALTRKFYLTYCAKEGKLEEAAQRVSFIGPFFDAIAVNEFQLASEISSISPTKWFKRYEYQDDYAYAMFMQNIVKYGVTDRSKLEPFLSEFEVSLEGNKDIRLDLCRAMCELDQASFDEALDELINQHEEYYNKLADPSSLSSLTLGQNFEPNRWLFIEGLAILRIAEKIGLSVEQSYKFCPQIARISNFGKFIPDCFPYMEV